jgi:HemY protein
MEAIMRLIFAFFILFLSVSVGLIFQGTSGYVLISLGSWTMQTSALFLLFALLAISLVLGFIMYMISRLMRIPRGVRRYYRLRRKRRTEFKIQQSVKALLYGHFPRAESMALSTAPMHPMPYYAYFLAAFSAFMTRDYDAMTHYLHAISPDTSKRYLGLDLIQAKFYLAHGAYDNALGLLKNAYKTAPKNAYIIQGLARCYYALEHIDDLLLLLPLLKKQGELGHEAFELFQEKAYVMILKHYQSLENWAALIGLAKQLPKSLQYHETLRVAYAHALIQLNEMGLAESVLRQGLSQHFVESWVMLYGETDSDLFKGRVLEHQLEAHSDSALLHDALGQYYGRHQLHGKAKYHFDMALKLQPSRIIMVHLAELHERLGEGLEAARLYRLAAKAVL